MDSFGGFVVFGAKEMERGADSEMNGSGRQGWPHQKPANGGVESWMRSKDSRQSQRATILQSSPLFLDLHAEEIALLAELCQDVPFAAGEVVFYTHEAGDSLYVVSEGEVEVLQELLEPGRPPQIITVMGRGEFFGEMSMLERSTRSATVRARTDAALLVLTTEDFYSFAKIFKNGFTVVIINIARILSQRLRQTTGRLREL